MARSQQQQRHGKREGNQPFHGQSEPDEHPSETKNALDENNVVEQEQLENPRGIRTRICVGGHLTLPHEALWEVGTFRVLALCGC